MPPQPLTQTELNAERCSNPECTTEHDELILESQCHPEAPHIVMYHKPSGVLYVLCAQCQRIANSIAVARSPLECAVGSTGVPSSEARH